MATGKVVFIHGWSVTHTDTYGELPVRLVHEAAGRGLNLSIEHLYLGRYVSFHDEVRISDLAFAMQRAVEDAGLNSGERFYCITHSTGGPLIREWYQRYYGTRAGCPMSHLVMLAPANFGSALAALGKGRVGRLKAWTNGVEPGQGVLDWLCLGSAEAYALNLAWLENGKDQIGPDRMFPFVLTGQTIDRKLYDNLNSYTGEAGSDGVVRVASANLNATRIQLEQTGNPDGEQFSTLGLRGDIDRGPRVPFRIIRGACHSGAERGIMRSVSRESGGAGRELVTSILRCCSVKIATEYEDLATEFAAETDLVQSEERVEKVKQFFIGTRVFFHDRHSQIIFRIRDSEGLPVSDFDLLLTAGNDSDPNHLPEGFFVDRQANGLSPGVLTYFVNCDAMNGYAAIPRVRKGGKGIEKLGLELHPRPEAGFVHFRKCRVSASQDLLERLIRPNETTLVDITLTRVVHEGVLRLDRTTASASFVDVEPGRRLN